MKNISIHHHQNGTLLFAGMYPTTRHAVEHAVSLGVSLAGANLAHANLDHATLDSGDFKGALLDDASLMGANLSEADFSHASMRHIDMSAACMAHSRFVNVDFTDTSFGATIIDGACFDGCRFNCPTALTLDFSSARLGHNIFELDNLPLPFTAAPVVITGLPARIAILDNHTIIGHTLYSQKDSQGRILDDIRAFYQRAAG